MSKITLCKKNTDICILKDIYCISHFFVQELWAFECLHLNKHIQTCPRMQMWAFECLHLNKHV